jgi:hypothetical protein
MVTVVSGRGVGLMGLSLRTYLKDFNPGGFKKLFWLLPG